jgi:hypothetical protein
VLQTFNDLHSHSISSSETETQYTFFTVLVRQEGGNIRHAAAFKYAEMMSDAACRRL